MSELENKRLTDLRVVDLRVELEKRGLDKNGVKQVLMQRLKEALEEEGHDPDTYSFDSNEANKKRRSSVPVENEDSEDKSEDIIEQPKKVEQPEKSKEPVSTNGVAQDKEKPVSEAKAQAQSEVSVAKKEAGVKKDNEIKKTDPPTSQAVTKETKPDKTEERDEKSAIEEDDDPIRLTLDDDETLHDVESETADKGRDDDTSTDDKKKKEGQDGKKKEESRSEKERNGDDYRRSGEKLTKKVGVKSNPNVVWVSNVAQNTRASELKAALSACGKVTGAKVVVNARYPGSSCFGYVTMGSLEDVDNVIAKLNNTELNGQMIKIEKFDQVRADQMKQLNDKSSSKSRKDEKSVADKREDVKDGQNEGDKKEGEKKEGEGKEHDTSEGPVSKERKGSKERRPSKDRTRRREDRPKGRQSRSPARYTKPRGGILTFAQIKEERDRQKFREKERILREESRRRQEEHARQKEIERRQRQEAMRLEREKEKLRIEKEKIEREKAELVRMERERQCLEREKIAREKLELERTLIRLEEDRRGKRPAPFRSDDRYDDRKRPNIAERHFDAPPAPRFEPPTKVRDISPKSKSFTSSKESYSKSRPHDGSYSEKRSRDYDGSVRSSSGPSSSSKYDRPYDRNEPRARDQPPSRSGKDRYMERERDRSPHSFRGSMRDDRKSEMSSSSRDHRYDGSSEPRFESRSSNNWSGPPKSFPPTSSKPWEKSEWRPTPGNDRWIPNNNLPPNRPFSSNPSMNLAPMCPPPPGINNYSDNRFEYGKSLGSSMRKY